MAGTRLLVITGGSRGLGAALVAHYRVAGWRVLDFSRSGSGPGSVPVDLARPEEAGARMAEALGFLVGQAFEEIVAIGNAARLGPIGPPAAQTARDMRAHFDVNLASGAIFAAQVLGAFEDHACPKTFAQITSGAALRPIRGWSLYGASKAGIEHFVRVVAEEQAGLAHPFRVISISPGVIDTGMQAEIRAGDAADFPDIAHFVELKRTGALRSPEEVAARVARIIASRPASGSRYEVADFG